jgi:hypothetical protein
MKKFINTIAIIGSIVFIFKMVLLVMNEGSILQIPLDSLLFDLLPLILTALYHLYELLLTLLKEWQLQRYRTGVTACIVILTLLLNIRPVLFFSDFGAFLSDTSLDAYWIGTGGRPIAMRIMLIANHILWGSGLYGLIIVTHLGYYIGGKLDDGEKVEWYSLPSIGENGIQAFTTPMLLILPTILAFGYYITSSFAIGNLILWVLCFIVSSALSGVLLIILGYYIPFIVAAIAGISILISAYSAASLL